MVWVVCEALASRCLVGLSRKSYYLVNYFSILARAKPVSAVSALAHPPKSLQRALTGNHRKRGQCLFEQEVVIKHWRQGRAQHVCMRHRHFCRSNWNLTCLRLQASWACHTSCLASQQSPQGPSAQRLAHWVLLQQADKNGLACDSPRQRLQAALQQDEYDSNSCCIAVLWGYGRDRVTACCNQWDGAEARGARREALISATLQGASRWSAPLRASANPAWLKHCWH
jgi:hypothetical protein